MTHLSTDELSDLTKIVNARIAEFGPHTLNPLTCGMVRIVHDVIAAWQAEAEPEPEPTPIYINGNGHAAVTVARSTNTDVTFAPVERVTMTQVAPPEPAPEPLPTIPRHAHTEAAVIAALREMAVDGIMPGQKAWDRDKPEHLPNNSAIRARLGIGWNELARRAGLPPNTGRVANLHKRKATPAQAEPTKPDLEPEPTPTPEPEKPMRVIQLPRTLAEVDAEATHPRHSKPAPAPRQHTRPPTADEVVAEVKRQSMGGVMPTPAAFDLARPAMWPTAGEFMAHHELSWSELAGLAGLRSNRVAEAVTA